MKMKMNEQIQQYCKGTDKAEFRASVLISCARQILIKTALKHEGLRDYTISRAVEQQLFERFEEELCLDRFSIELFPGTLIPNVEAEFTRAAKLACEAIERKIKRVLRPMGD